MAAIRAKSGMPAVGGGRVRLAAGSLVAMTSSSKPPGVKMYSIRQPAAPTVYSRVASSLDFINAP